MNETKNIVLIILIISILSFIFSIQSKNITIKYIPIILRLIGLLLFEYLDPMCAYLLNATLIDGMDSRLIFDTFNTFDKFTIKDYTNTTSYLYQDKIIDNLMRFVSLSYNYNDMLAFLYVFRSIGEILMFITNNEKFLFYFPDLFQIYYLKDLPILNQSKSLQNIYVIIGSMIKIFLEYHHHYQKSNINLYPNSYLCFKKNNCVN